MPPKRDPIEEGLSALSRASITPSDQAAEAIADGLKSRYPAVVARAAVLAGELDLRELEAPLLSAYERLSEDPEKLDPACVAMKEIAATLFGFGTQAPNVYLHAAGHVQLAGWDNQDVGAPLRGLGVQALVKIEHPSALTLATDMLTDDQDWARIGAARALRVMSFEASAHVLRLKLRAGDLNAEVLGECFGAMLEYSPAWIDVVAAYLTSENDVLASLAALAIGEARPAGALEHLKQAWESQTQPDTRETILNAIASLRSDEAVAFLVELVKGESMTALQAMSALTLYAASESVVSQVRAAAKANKRREVASMFERLFGM